ncbi:hypothetical protein QLG06_14825 [Pseudomonas sp. V104_6]|uniref:hypothetical protein n=1 Tax=Pseudomonas sp. V104_6 TaxID=3044230 RepID=UPI00249D9E4A|nr:hypothetical protein [Pseudomonas sp. V104_6]MDI3375605.1 hypothetical protein [Pseudomonas sp. V104_6]
MKTLLGVVSVSLLLAGCGKTTDQICNETNIALAQATGQGFVDVGWIGCLKQSPSEAQKSLDGLKKELAAKGIHTPKPISHDEMQAFVDSADPLEVILKLGPASSATWVAKDAQGKNIPVKIEITPGVERDGSLMVSYSSGRNAPANERRPELLKEVEGKLAIRENGDYHFYWSKPLTYGLLGIEDDHMSFHFQVRNGKALNTSLLFPKHLWQNWF